MLRKGIAVAGILAFSAMGTATAQPVSQKLRGPAPNLTFGQVAGASSVEKLTVNHTLLQQATGLASVSTQNAPKGSAAALTTSMRFKSGSSQRHYLQSTTPDPNDRRTSRADQNGRTERPEGQSQQTREDVRRAIHHSQPRGLSGLDNRVNLRGLLPVFYCYRRDCH
jgi:hypothetical protein